MKNIINWEEYIFEWSKCKEVVSFLNSNYMYSVLKYLQGEYKTKVIFPKKENIFKAFELCAPNDVKVVILNQDPYPNGNATGLAFANPENVISLSPSLKKIKETVEINIGKMKLDFDPTLESWAKQGVLLLNTALTVQQEIPNSHKKVWDKFTKFMLTFIMQHCQGCIFMLWGSEAQKYEQIGEFNMNDWVYVKKAVHPSFAYRKNRIWECSHFGEANKIIKENNGEEFCIKW